MSRRIRHKVKIGIKVFYPHSIMPSSTNSALFTPNLTSLSITSFSELASESASFFNT